MDLRASQRRAFQAFARVHGRLLVRTKGRPRWLGWRQSALVLETVGRRSGEVRAVPLLYMPHDEHFVILASNYGQEHPPAWWHNLQARPEAAVLWSGRRIPVRAEVVDGDDRVELVRRAREHCAQWRAYLANVDREIPIVVLRRRGDPD
ncbi:MAG: nitroreductase family deazaflavin-dependent oxidoreductase [Acidimicrobiales bacterium]